MKQHIENLIAFEIEKGIIESRDYHYVKNQLYYLLGETILDEKFSPQLIQTPSEALEPILDILVQKGRLHDSVVERDLFDAKIMNVFSSLPSTLEKNYYALHKTSKSKATDYLYNYAKSLNYIRYDRILKNISFDYNPGHVDLQITINLSKPEKDPKDIIKAAKFTDVNYPLCVLCKENEGFSGNQKRDSRDQHRLIELQLNGEDWYFQYSPYIYYNEHAIVLSKEHVPMKISKQTFENLFELVDQFDGYFFGSNADLPIVGGSILSHDHYQGGKHKFPIENAKKITSFKSNDIDVDLLDWPLSTIRLRSKNKTSVVGFADKVLAAWKNYTNPDLDIIAYSGTTPHNTITPVARYKDDYYELDLILRNNRTTDTYPLGIFHPHADKHHIKKENIGLIEAIGLAILPARLIDAVAQLKAYYFDQKPLNEQTTIHQRWFDQIAKQQTLRADNFDDIIKFEIGKVFEQVLIDCGVFKKGSYEAFISFVKELIV